MGRFDWEAGLFHLAFANEDTYYLKGLVKLRLRQFLYWELRFRGYDSVFFFEGGAGDFRFTMADEYSQDVYEDYREKGMFGKLLRLFTWEEQEETMAGRRLPVEDERRFWEQIARMLLGEKMLALVFSIESFAALRDYPEMLEALERARQGNYSRKNLILIQAPVSAAGSRGFLTDKQGIFHSGLFPEIRRIFEKRRNIHLYERLKEELGQRVCFLNTLELQQIKNMVRYILIKQEKTPPGVLGRADAYACYIWTWYHSRAFRAAEGDMLPQNKKRLLSVIGSWIEDKQAFGRLDVRIRDLERHLDERTSLEAYLRDRYPADKWQSLIYEDNSLSAAIEQLPLERAFGRMEAAPSWIGRLERLQKELQKPSTLFDIPEGAVYAMQCAEAMKDACDRGDSLMMEKAVAALDYAVRGDFLEDMEEDGKMPVSGELHIKIIQAAKKLGDFKRLYQENEARIKQDSRLLMTCIREIQEYERKNPYIKEASSESPDGHFLQNKKLEATNLNSDIQNRKYLNAQEQALIGRFRESIQKMEMAVSTLAAGNMQDLTEDMGYVGSLIKSVVAENSALLKELSGSSWDVQQTIQEASRLQQERAYVSKEEIDREYEELLREQGDFLSEKQGASYYS